METSHDSPRFTAGPDGPFSGEGFNAQTQKFIREHPEKAVGLAVLGGLFFSVLPLGKMAGGVVRLAFALLRPILLVLGAVKLYEEFEKKQKP